MATAQQIATSALLRIRVVSAEDTPSSADMAIATDALTAMVASWEGQGLSGVVFPLPARFDQGLIAMLAIRLCDEFGKEPTALLVRDADDGWSSIRAAHFVVPSSRFDSSIRNTGHYSSADFVYGQSPGGYSVWSSNTSYELRQFVTHLGHEYECIGSGLSGVDGPTGTGTTVYDGTATWRWRRMTESAGAPASDAEASGDVETWADAQW